MIDLSGKRALVCGGTKGIGEAAAKALKDCGASVVVLSRTASGNDTIACDMEDIVLSVSYTHLTLPTILLV